ncbi:MAG TPA: (4Fe-4S)-binding protein [Acidimicrobiia bacterium]|nr:(4Fe-4S)-binding protein [Acidimicrobiia bacterium]
MAKRTYETDAIRVLWNSERCIHTGNCLRALPAVFDTGKRPWVTIEGAAADEIARAIERCPSGALQYERLDDDPGEQPPKATTIVPRRTGPLYVRGDVTVETPGGAMERGYRMVLCRCGASRNQPFCDNSHKDIGFSDNPRVIPTYREAADDPSDLEE